MRHKKHKKLNTFYSISFNIIIYKKNYKKNVWIVCRICKK